jgi:uncharacterized protein (TIGR02421 family)
MPGLREDPEGFARDVSARLLGGDGVRRDVTGGRLHIDRALPFLCVYRCPPEPVAGVAQLLYGQPAYLVASGEDAVHEPLCILVRQLAAALGERFGAHLVVEVWPATGTTEEADASAAPCFRLHAPNADGTPTTVDVLAGALARIPAPFRLADVDVVAVPSPAPPGMRPLLPERETRELGVLIVGVEVPTFFADPADGILPVVHRRLQRDFGRALRAAVFEFAHVQTTYEARDPRALGRRAIGDVVAEVDRALWDVAAAFDYLLFTTPINADQAWDDFAAGGYGQTPTFHYRPLTIDPDLFKRRLYEVPVERVEDPTLADLFRSQRRELDCKLTLLDDRDTPAFLPESLQLYGSAGDDLLALAAAILDRIAPEDRSDEAARSLDAAAFAQLAGREIAGYREREGEFDAGVQIRDDVPGVLVSDNQLMIGSRYRIAEARADALVAHEVGTHLLTYLNGAAQPLRQLQMGLPGYEETQEGLAVFAEYVSGGLTPARMALLAARVVAVHRCAAGRGFVEVFEELCDGFRLEPQRAFDVTMRVFRAGGLTKDVIYLRGLTGVLDYLAAGGDRETLLVGKLHLDFVPIVQELRWRQVLRPAPLRPHWMDVPGAAKRLAAAHRGLSALTLSERSHS